MRSLRGLRGRRGGRVQQYVAVVPIVHNGVRAYNVGYPVPVSNVEKYGYLEQGLVRAIGEPAPPAASTTPILRLSVRCKRRQLLAVYDVDPPILLGFFAADVLRLQDADVVAPGPVHLLAWLRAGRAAADFVESVIADAATPLQLWCPNHKQATTCTLDSCGPSSRKRTKRTSMNRGARLSASSAPANCAATMQPRNWPST